MRHRRKVKKQKQATGFSSVRHNLHLLFLISDRCPWRSDMGIAVKMDFYFDKSLNHNKSAPYKQ